MLLFQGGVFGRGSKTETILGTRWWFEICFIFTPLWGKISNLTNIFQMG